MAATKSRSTADTQSGVTRGNCFVIWPPGTRHQHRLLIGCNRQHWTVIGWSNNRVSERELCFISSFVPPWKCLTDSWVYSLILGRKQFFVEIINCDEPFWSHLKCSFWFHQLLSSRTVRVCVCLLNIGIETSEREDQTREASLRSLSVHIQGNVCTLLALTHATLKIRRRRVG